MINYLTINYFFISFFAYIWVTKLVNQNLRKP